MGTGAAGAAAKRLARTLRALKDVPSRVSSPFADYVTTALKEKTAAGLDPYGKPLAPLAAATVRKKGHSRILYQDGALQGTERAEPLPGGGVALLDDAWYAPFHITGTKRPMPPRPFFPVNVMPAAWRAELQRLLEAAYQKGLP